MKKKAQPETEKKPEEQLDLLGLLPDGEKWAPKEVAVEAPPYEPVDPATADAWAQAWFDERAKAWGEQKLMVRESPELLRASLAAFRADGADGLRTLIEEVGHPVKSPR